MQKAYERYIKAAEWKDRNVIDVIDIGGANVNGGYADIFSTGVFRYRAVDIRASEGVDVVLADPYVLPFEDESIDIVISGQAFEHVEFFWRLFKEMTRILKPDGLLILIAPSSGPIHKYPLDCYRFYPDAYGALAKDAGIDLIDVWMDRRGPWNDLVGIFSKTHVEKYESNGRKSERITFGPNRYEMETQPVFVSRPHKLKAVEKIQGTLLYLDVLKKLHATLTPGLYLEIGVRHGNSLKLSNCTSIGVDPMPAEGIELKPIQKVFRITSDDFFEFYAQSELQNRQIDFAFIDGMHFFEFALRDFINIEKYASNNTVVVIDDIHPNHPMQAERKRVSQVWTGDVWKLKGCLEKYRPDLNVVSLDTTPTGLLVITGLKPCSRVLERRYNRIVREFTQKVLSDRDPVIRREGVLSPNNSRFWKAIECIGMPQEHKRLLQLAKSKQVQNPEVSLVVVNFNMARELPRTLATLRAEYQQDVKAEQIEVIVVDNGSTNPIVVPENMTNVRVLKVAFPNVSPVQAVNLGLHAAKAEMIGVFIDGARMASPGLVKYALQAKKLSTRPIVATLGFHLGSEVQMNSVEQGYCQEEEDKLLEGIPWQKDGYRLFDISIFAGSSIDGWFAPIAESNALFMTKTMWTELGGYDERFQTPGGGLANLDTYKRALALPSTDFFVLLGEGTFHQVHGGIATNQKREDACWKVFHDEYKRIRGKGWIKSERKPMYLGSFNFVGRNFPMPGLQ